MAKKKSNDITKTGPLKYSDIRTLNALNQLTGNTMVPFTDEDVSDFLYKHNTPDDIDIIRGSIAEANDFEDKLISTPIAQNSDGKDFWGNSFFDSDIVVGRHNIDRLSDIRAENQPWFSKLVNGVGKAGILAATTAAELGGLIYGIGQGAYNAYNEEGGASAKAGAFLHGLWDNPITESLKAINDASEELMPNYYTQDELENPFSNIFTANFLGDKILKNLGFMVGAFYGGIPISKGIGALGRASVRTAREALNAEMQGMGRAFADITKNYSDDVLSEVGKLSREAKGLSKAEAATVGTKYSENARKLYSELSQRGLTEGDKGRRMFEGLEKINRIANRTKAATQFVGALGSAINEGAIEAINNSRDWANSMTMQENDRYEKEVAAIEAKYGGVDTQEALAEKYEAAQKHEMTLADIEKERATMGNADLLMNIPILTYSNWLQLGKLYTRGFESTRRRMGSIWNSHTLSGTAKEGTLKSDKTWKGAVLKGLRNSLSEGAEEYLQRSASDASGNVVMDAIRRHVKSGNSEDSKISLDQYITGFAKAVADNAGNPEAWEEFMIGALSSMVGMPVFGSQTKNAYGFMKNNGVFGFAGGMVGSYEDYMAEKAKEKKIAEYLNGRVKEKSFNDLYTYLRRSGDYEQALMTALQNNDKEEYKNLEAEKLFEDINAFASAGHLEEFKQLIGYNDDYNDAELEDIVKLTSRPVTAEQQRQNDENRLKAINDRLAQIDKSLESAETDVEGGVDDIKREIWDTKDLLDEEFDPDKAKELQEKLDVLNERLQFAENYDSMVETFQDEKEDLEGERERLKLKLDANLYTDRDDGEFFQMVNGTPIGMNLIADKDENGEPIPGTEGNEMRRILDRNRRKLLKGIDDYLSIRDNIDVETGGVLEDGEISLLTKLRMQILDKETRTLEMVDDLIEGLRPTKKTVDAVLSRSERALEKAKEAHTAAKKLLTEAKANSEVSPETVAELEQELVNKENALKKAKESVVYSRNAAGILGWMTDQVKTSKRERKALDKGYGENMFGRTYSDLYSNEERNLNSEEVQNMLTDPLNVAFLAQLLNLETNAFTDHQRRKYLEELASLSSLARDRKEYKEAWNKYINKHELLKKDLKKVQDEITEEELDNISDKLSLRIRRAKDLVEIDRILNSTQVMPEVKDMALKKAKENGDEDFKKLITDYERARAFYKSFIEKMLQYSSSGLQDTLVGSADVAWGEALADTSDTSKYDKFIQILDEFADDIADTNKDESDIIKDALKELQSAESSTSTNSSEAVRTASSASSSTSSKDTGGTKGTTTGLSLEKVTKRIDDDIKKAIRDGKEISGIDSLSAPIKTFISSYNTQNPGKEIDDNYVLERFQALSDVSLRDEDSESDDGKGGLSEQDYISKKSDEMKGHLRVSFNGTGITEFRIYAGKSGGTLLETKTKHAEDFPEEAKAIWQVLNDTHAFEFLRKNYLGYLQKSLRPGESITVHLLRPNNSNVGNRVFLAIEWTNDVASAIRRAGFGHDSKVTIPDTSIEAIDKEGNTKKYQIIGDLSILDDKKDMDPAIKNAFDEVVDAVNTEVNPVLESESNKENGKQWAVSSLTSEIDEIYTGRLDKGENPDEKKGLKELLFGTEEWKEGVEFPFGVAGSGSMDVDVKNPNIVLPNKAWVEHHRGAIVLFVPKPDGKLYPIRCTRKTVAEWLDGDGSTLLKEALDGKGENDYLRAIVNTLKTLFDTKASVGARVKAKAELRKYFVMGFGNREVSIIFDNDRDGGGTVRVSFDKAAVNSHTITIDTENPNKNVEAFFDILKKEGIPFSMPLPSSNAIKSRQIIEAGIFKIGLNDFYNFNPSFTITPINKAGRPVNPDVPEEERKHFDPSNKERDNSWELDLGSGPFLYHIDRKSSTPVVYKSKVDKHGKPVGTPEKVTDPIEYKLVKGIDDILKKDSDGDKAFPTMLNALLPGDSYKKRKEIISKLLGNSWSRVYLLRTDDGVWYFDNRSSSHNKIKIFKQDSTEAKALKKELEDDIKKHEKEINTELMSEDDSKKGTTIEDILQPYDMELWPQVKEFLAQNPDAKAKVSLIQKKFSIGYNRAKRYMDAWDIEKSKPAEEKKTLKDIGKETLNKLGYKKQDRHSNGHVRGGQSGWKLRFVVKNPKTGKAFTQEEVNNDKKAYLDAAMPLLNWLKEYFSNPDGTDVISTSKPQSGYDGYVAHYHFTGKDGNTREPFKFLTGGEVGESDFTIYIGSMDDVNKFMSDVQSSPINDLLAEGNNNISDTSFSPKMHGRIEGSSIGFSKYALPEGLERIVPVTTVVYEDARVIISIGENVKTGERFYILEDKKSGTDYVYRRPNKDDSEDSVFNYVNNNLVEIRTKIAENVYGDYIAGSNTNLDSNETKDSIISKIEKATTNDEVKAATDEAAAAVSKNSLSSEEYDEIIKAVQDKYNMLKEKPPVTKVLSGRTLASFKPAESPKIVEVLKSIPVSNALGKKFIDEIYADLQMLEDFGVSILEKDIVDKIKEIIKYKKPKQQKDSWEEFVTQKKCGGK